MVRSGENIPLQSPSQMSQPLVFLLGRIVFQIPFPEVFFSTRKNPPPQKKRRVRFNGAQTGNLSHGFLVFVPKKRIFGCGTDPFMASWRSFFFRPILQVFQETKTSMLTFHGNSVPPKRLPS